ncbi:hypothetical protein PVAP13_6KG390700 [Panicum virgatum]|uniref:Uncharacterized protein n=1 Tax=Panicum virgatum TaxID=38727 RepID=A0A8T0RKK7_PANVG|nr:hypothetical protein PVAP13_6KG390700 [Panicum virgatum]
MLRDCTLSNCYSHQFFEPRIEKESAQHLFFVFLVADRMWTDISSIIIGRKVGDGFESIGTCWLSQKRFTITNIICATALWRLWKLRNDIYFHNVYWKSMKRFVEDSGGRHRRYSDRR